MDVLELSVLSAAKASDFEISHSVGMGRSGLVVAARCTRPGLPNPSKLYALKLLFNFTHEYTSVMRNAYENEWLVLSRVMPHPSVVRFWSQFISEIPDSLLPHLPAEIRKAVDHSSRMGRTVRRKGQFLVLDFHKQDLQAWLNGQQCPLGFEQTLRFTEQLLEATLYLENALIRHLDLKPANILVAESERLVLCDFGCAVQFSDSSFALKYVRGSLPGGNRAHLAPEVVNKHHLLRTDPSGEGTISYLKETSFAVGVLVHEIATSQHPLLDYPLAYTRNGVVEYSVGDIQPLPAFYPNSFCSIVTDLLQPDPVKRIALTEALQQLRLCCLRKQSFVGVGGIQGELDRVKQERDLAKAKLSVMAAERDFAMGEVKQMVEQCQSIAEEFETMSRHTEALQRELRKAQEERNQAIQVSEGAYEVNKMLREQLALVSRERDLARKQVDELREIASKSRMEDRIDECKQCLTFYIASANNESACLWHPGKHVHNRWSCCYKPELSAEGCKTSKHVPIQS